MRIGSGLDLTQLISGFAAPLHFVKSRPDPKAPFWIAILPAGLISSVYQWLTRPLIITRVAPSLWIELGRVAISDLVADIVRLSLRLSRQDRFGPLRVALR